MGTKTKVAIVLFILQIVSVAGQVLSTNGGDFLGAVGSALGLCAFTIIGIILVLILFFFFFLFSLRQIF